MSIKESSKKPIWLIVYFPDSNTYSVIPKTWIVEHKIREKITYCALWPPAPTVVTSDFIKEDPIPTSEWTAYKIRILDNGKEYSSFNKAWHKQVEVKQSETSTESETPHKKLNWISCLQDSESDGDSSLGYNIFNNNGDNDITDISPISEYVTNFARESSAGSSTSQPFDDSKKIDCLDIGGNTNSDHSLSNLSSSQNLGEATDLSKLCSTSTCVTTELTPLNNYGLYNTTLTNIYKEQIAIKMICNRLMSKIDNFEVILNSMKKYGCPLQLDDGFLSLFPLKNSNEFKVIENNIITDSNFASKLESFISSIGGSTPKHHVNRSLMKLFTDLFAVTCTWTGRGKDITTKLCDTKLIEIVKKTIIGSCTTVNFTQSDFEKVVGEWFRHANTRVSRSKKN